MSKFSTLKGDSGSHLLYSLLNPLSEKKQTDASQSHSFHDFYPIRLINSTLDGHPCDGFISYVTDTYSAEF